MFVSFNSTNSINGSNNPSGPSLVESSYIRDNHSEVLLRGRWADVGQQARKPPSTGRVTPLIMLLFSLSRNKMLFTTSSTSAHRHTHHTQLYRANPDTTCADQSHYVPNPHHANWSRDLSVGNTALTLGRFPCMQELNTNRTRLPVLPDQDCCDWPAKRPRGIRDFMLWAFSGSLQPKRPMSVITTVGFTVFTRIWTQDDTWVNPVIEKTSEPVFVQTTLIPLSILFFMLAAGQAAVSKVTS